MSGPAGLDTSGDSGIAGRAGGRAADGGGAPVPESVLAGVLGTSTERVRAACERLAEEYECQGRGFVLARVAGGYRFQTAPAQDAYVERFVRRGPQCPARRPPRSRRWPSSPTSSRCHATRSPRSGE